MSKISIVDEVGIAIRSNSLSKTKSIAGSYTFARLLTCNILNLGCCSANVIKSICLTMKSSNTKTI